MLTESRQSIATSVQRLVEHAGRVQGQIESELGSFRTVGQAYMKLSKESNELNDRCVTNESSIDVTTRELAAQNKLVLELNARIGDMQRELAEEKSNRIGLESQLQDAVQCNERDRAEFQEQLRLAREQSQNELHSLREQSMSEAQDLQNAHKAEVDEMHQKHTAESLQQTNSFKSLEKRLDNVAQNHEKQITMARN